MGLSSEERWNILLDLKSFHKFKKKKKMLCHFDGWYSEARKIWKLNEHLWLQGLRLDLDFPQKTWNQLLSYLGYTLYTHYEPLLNDSLSVLLPFSHQHLHIFFAQWKHSRAPWFTAQWRFTAIFCLLYDPGLVFRNAEHEGTPHCRSHLSNHPHNSPFNPNFSSPILHDACVNTSQAN